MGIRFNNAWGLGSRDLATGVYSHLSHQRPRGAWALEPGDEGGPGDGLVTASDQECLMSE